MVVGSHILEQTVQQADLERVVIGNCYMLLAALSSSQLDMRSSLPTRLIAKAPQRMDQISATAIAGYFHAASTSSRT
jgi:hypothetical protein